MGAGFRGLRSWPLCGWARLSKERKPGTNLGHNKPSLSQEAGGGGEGGEGQP